MSDSSLHDMISVGIDIGTTTLRATALKIEVSGQTKNIEPLSQTLSVLTPFNPGGFLDGPRILEHIKLFLGSIPAVDAGHILFTGEAQKAPNALEIGNLLSSQWPNFLSATLNPETESRLAALGSGTLEWSELHPGHSFVHLDIGGGTTNLARVENGRIIDTACVDLGCRKWVFDNSKILRRAKNTEKLERLLKNNVSQDPNEAASLIAELILKSVTHPEDPKLANFWVVPWKERPSSSSRLSISGGVSDVWNEGKIISHQDLGAWIASFLKQKLKSANIEYRISERRGHATVFGVSSGSFEIPGISIGTQGTIPLPVRNLQLCFDNSDSTNPVALFVRGVSSSNDTLHAKAMEISRQIKSRAFTIILMKENLGLSFSYWLSKVIPEHAFLVLDELPLPKNDTDIYTVDISRLPKDRFMVAIKSLHLF